MSAHDRLKPTQFGDVIFPGETHTLDGEYRHHVHEYPHSPGGAPEKLGRKLYSCSIRAPFHDTFPAYPNLYPIGMNTIRGYFELGATLPLVHPTIGTFPAFITRWRQVKQAKTRSGETVDIDFLEDQDASFAVAANVTIAPHQAIGRSAAQIAASQADVQAQLQMTTTDISAIDALQSALTEVAALQDTSTLYGNLYAAKVQQVADLCSQLDGAISLQDARAFPLVDAIQIAWQQSLQIQKDLQAQRATIQYYTVPYRQSLMQVAVTLYGDASRQSDLLSLNSDRVDNPMRVPANTQLRYYPNTPQQQIALLSA